MKVGTMGVFGATCLLVMGALASGASKENTEMVDSGSFSVLVHGQKVATETFSVQQRGGGSTVKSEVKVAGSEGKTGQTSELQLGASGDLVHYEWREAPPSSSSLTVTPNDQFLIERVTSSSGDKPAEQPFLMPTTTLVLDNNFFIYREVLAWRYLAANCHQESGTTKCTQQPADFGVIVPQDRISMRVSLELVGAETVKIGGLDRQLIRLNLKSDNGVWALWLDDHFKLMRILVTAADTEVVRD